MSTEPVGPVAAEPATGAARSWGPVLAFGIVSVALGVVMLVWPKQTVAVIAVLLGVWLRIEVVAALRVRAATA